jgi:hypothetical protein
VRRRGGKVDKLRHTPDLGNQLKHLLGHQQSAVAWFCALSVFDLYGSRVFNHMRQGMDDLIPPEIA